MCKIFLNNFPKKKLEFFNKTQIKYEFLTLKNTKIHIKFMFF